MLIKTLIRFLKWQDKKLTSLSMRAMKWTGRSDRAIHPKHLYDDNRNASLHKLFFHGMVFLDIGSGSGSDLLYALEKGASHVYGAEKDQNAIAISHDRMKDYAGKYTIFECDLEKAKIDIPDNSVDIINFSNVLEHLHNREGILAELQRVLKPDGRLYISIPNTNTPWKKWQRAHGIDSRDDEDHKIEYSEETLQEELEAASLMIATPLHPLVPSLPIHGPLSLTAVISPKLYKASQNWKIRYAKENPEHSVGWHFLAQRKA